MLGAVLGLVVTGGAIFATLDEGPEQLGGGRSATAAGSWRPMNPAPLAPRILPASAWTGDELVVWGGRTCAAGRCDDETAEAFGDGAAYRPGADTWRSLAGSPLGARSGVAAVWTGEEVLLWGGRDVAGPRADGAAYDPRTDRWRPLPPAPLSARSVQATWTGREMLLWGGTVAGTAGEVAFADGAAYDPAAGTWRPLAAAPLSGRFDMVATWTGSELVVWGGRAGATNLDDGAAYDPGTDAWRPLAGSPLSGRVARGVWTGREVLVWGGEQGARALADGAAYDPGTDAWRALAPSPLSARRGAALAWTGDEMLVWGGGGGTGSFFFGTGAGYDPGTDAWRELPSTPGRFIPETAWTGDEMLVWGGIVAGGGGGASATVAPAADGVRYDPAP